MNKLHFNGLKTIETPKDWKEKALRIPEQAKKPEPYRVSPFKSAVIAASFILVTALSITVILQFQNKNPVAVSPSPSDLQTTAASKPEKESANPQTTAETSSSKPKDQTEAKENPTEIETQISTDAQGNPVITTITTITTVTDDTPAEPKETDDPVSGSDEAQGAPTAAADDNTYDSDSPQITIEIFYNPRSSELEPDGYSSDITAGASDSSETIHGFCLIFSETGDLIGESKYFHSQRFAQIELTDDGRRKISYCPADHGIVLNTGRYRCILLDEYKREIGYSWLDIE